MKRKLEDPGGAVAAKDAKCSESSSPGGGHVSSTDSASPASLTFQVANESYDVYVSNQENDEDEVIAGWFSRLHAGIDAHTEKSESLMKAMVGLDCEWCPPWFRDNKPEKVNTIQLYSPFSDCLILSVGEWNALPPLLVDMLADKRIAKVGVNVTGDGSRLARDFNCTVSGMFNVEKGHGPRMTMEKLCSLHCPKEFHIDKDSIESKVRLGNWASWPLSELQLKYASMDAVLSFAIYLYLNKQCWNSRCSIPLPQADKMKLDSCDPLPEDQKKELQRASSTEGKNSNFFLMHQNRSIVPPNMNKKEYPEGDKNSLQGKVIVISGVLDSMSRDDMSDYVKKHGGKVSKSITKGTTHLVNDHGTIGPSKLSKCQAQGVPIVGEDAIFDLVKGVVSN